MSWKDPYTSSLDAAAAAAGESTLNKDGPTFGSEGAPRVTTTTWTRCVSSDADGKVYWHDAQTGVSQWEEPGAFYIRRAIRDAERAAAEQRRAAHAARRAAAKAARLAQQMGLAPPAEAERGGGGGGAGVGRRGSKMIAGAMRRASLLFTGTPYVKSGGENVNAIDTLGNSGAEGQSLGNSVAGRRI